MTTNGNVLHSLLAEQFDTKHGNDGLQIRGWLVFSDGAMRSEATGEFREPPLDPHVLFPIIALYNETRRQQAQLEPVYRTQPTALQLVEAFHDRHGRDCIQINSWFYYSDGAQRDIDLQGALVEPSADDYERCKSIKIYYEELLRRATAEFEQIRSDMLKTAKLNLKYPSNTPPPPNSERAVNQLKRLRARVAEYKQHFDEAKENLEAVTPHWLRMRPALDATAKSQNEEFAAAVGSVQV